MFIHIYIYIYIYIYIHVTESGHRFCRGTTTSASASPSARVAGTSTLYISLKLSINSFGKSRFPHKSANFFFISLIKKDKLSDLCGN